MTADPAIDFQQFEALTFDCYGTLIDWETGLGVAFERVLGGHGIEIDREEVLERYARHEATAEAGPYLRYRDVLATGLRGVCAELGIEPSPAEVDAFSGSVVDWPPFPDSAAALARLKKRYRLGVITNCDDDLFAGSNRRLGVEFDWIVTAEQARSYKPSERNFRLAFQRLGVPRARILHVAQSLFHDHVPAKHLGLTSVWINRRHDRPGSGATPVVDANQGVPPNDLPAATYPDMVSFAVAATATEPA